MSKIKLEDCSWCETSKNLLVFDNWDYLEGDRFYVLCHGCSATGPSEEDEEEAAKKWNKVMKVYWLAITLLGTKE